MQTCAITRLIPRLPQQPGRYAYSSSAASSHFDSGTGSFIAPGISRHVPHVLSTSANLTTATSVTAVKHLYIKPTSVVASLFMTPCTQVRFAHTALSVVLMRNVLKSDPTSRERS